MTVTVGSIITAVLGVLCLVFGIGGWWKMRQEEQARKQRELAAAYEAARAEDLHRDTQAAIDTDAAAARDGARGHGSDLRGAYDAVHRARAGDGAEAED